MLRWDDSGRTKAQTSMATIAASSEHLSSARTPWLIRCMRNSFSSQQTCTRRNFFYIFFAFFSPSDNLCFIPCPGSWHCLATPDTCAHHFSVDSIKPYDNEYCIWPTIILSIWCGRRVFTQETQNAIFAGARKKRFNSIGKSTWPGSARRAHSKCNAIKLNDSIVISTSAWVDRIYKISTARIYTYYIQAACVCVCASAEHSSLPLESHWLVCIAQVCHRATMAFCPRMCAGWCHCTWKNDILISVLSDFLAKVRIRIMNFGYSICAEHKISISHQSENNDSIEIVNWYYLAGYFRRTCTHKLAKIGFDFVLEWRRDGSLFIPVTMVMRYANCEPIQFVRMHTINDWPEYSIDSHISIGISTVYIVCSK